MQKAYYRIIWMNYPSEDTPVNERNLNRMDAALDELDNRIIGHETTKANLTNLSKLLKEASYDENTGVVTFTRYNGETITLNTKLEKLAVNFSYDYANERLVITLDDGTEQYVDMSALITVYEFINSDTIMFTVISDGKVTADIKDYSIGEIKLQPNYLADIKVQANIATQEATKAATQSSIATTEANRAQTEADRAAQYADIVAPGFYVDIDNMMLYMKAGVGVEFIMADNTLCWKIA
ncbi:MAG: hypothetical protein E7290_14550 [Lachnospiraceae bacterium]|nr:hypothetical protein [Lachnospiraceae bacterium]